MQIQQGMERLRTAAPEVFQSLGLPTLPPNLVPPVPGVDGNSSPAQPAPAPAPAGNDQIFNQLMGQMMGQMRAGNPDQPPEERFASQLEQLASMGFVDRQANIQGRSTAPSHWSSHWYVMMFQPWSPLWETSMRQLRGYSQPTCRVRGCPRSPGTSTHDTRWQRVFCVVSVINVI